ncbi:MAG: amylo-alpha-1,6-glucosidase [Anaerolineae bacterium]|jgi:predicted glycogen debranching enzyme
MLDFGRDLCSDLRFAGEREWLVTNGVGGYASGTVAGMLTRRYHGVLIAALQPPVGRTLLVAKFDETATYGGRAYPLFANRWRDGQLEPEGYHHLERFHLEGTTPVWTFACADALLEKRVWMQQGATAADAVLHNTTYVRYDLCRGSSSLELSIKALVNHRDHHGSTRAEGWQMRIERVPHGLQVTAQAEAAPFYVLSDHAEPVPQHEWYTGYYLSVEDYRGLDALEDHLYAGLFQATLQPGESLTLVASTQANLRLDGLAAYAEQQAYQEGLLQRAPPAVEPLVLAADQFIVRRSLPGEPGGRSVNAGYPWFGDWGRDTMISLPGLTLATGRQEVAAQIITTFAHYAREGMLPNRFPEAGEEPEYNTVDATLWYFEAIRAYHAVTGDDGLLRRLFLTLAEIIDWHRRGTRFGIRLDPEDGLLYAGQEGVQLTWMDAKVDDWVVTPRIGKPVEINALWHNALRIMSDVAQLVGESSELYADLADRAVEGFARFWNEEAGFCYDVIDSPDGDDPTLRPNQLLAVSLPHSPLSEQQQRSVVDACARHLLTSHGLRSLAPEHPDYTSHYGGDRRTRDAAYHQGTVWAWLIGPFVLAHLRVYRDAGQARGYLQPLLRHLRSHGLGSISEIFDGDPPFTPRGCFAQAWSVAEVLRAWHATDPEQMGQEGKS